MEEVKDEREIREAAKRFGEVHEDAKAYFPPNGVHHAFWAVIRVEKLYWVGGFGDTHYIGWVPLDMYRTALDAHRQPAAEDHDDETSKKNVKSWSRLFYQQAQMQT